MDDRGRPEGHCCHAALAEPSLEVDLLGVHEEPLVEAAHGTELRGRDPHRGADDPVHLGLDAVRAHVVADRAVPGGRPAEASQWGQPRGDLVADPREVAADPRLPSALVDHPRRQDGVRTRAGGRDHVGHEGGLDGEVAVEHQHRVAGGRTDSRVHVGPEAAVGRPPDHLDPRTIGEGFGRRVVGDDHLHRDGSGRRAGRGGRGWERGRRGAAPPRSPSRRPGARP